MIQSMDELCTNHCRLSSLILRHCQTNTVVNDDAVEGRRASEVESWKRLSTDSYEEIKQNAENNGKLNIKISTAY